MYQIIRKQTRPNTDVPFCILRTSDQLSEEVKKHFWENYISKEKHLLATDNVSENGLELTIVTIWDSQESFLEFKSDEICNQMATIVSDHCLANGITNDLISAGDI
jgi:hypothetical protein